MKFVKISLKYLQAIFYAFAGANHFLHPEFYLKMMPPALPWHLGLVYLSGFIEILLGILLLIPKFTRLAAWGIIALLLAVFPANIYLAMNSQLMPDVSHTAHLIRLPFQLVFLVWAWWYTRPEKNS